MKQTKNLRPAYGLIIGLVVIVALTGAFAGYMMHKSEQRAQERLDNFEIEAETVDLLFACQQGSEDLVKKTLTIWESARAQKLDAAPELNKLYASERIRNDIGDLRQAGEKLSVLINALNDGEWESPKAEQLNNMYQLCRQLNELSLQAPRLSYEEYKERTGSLRERFHAEAAKIR